MKAIPAIVCLLTLIVGSACVAQEDVGRLPAIEKVEIRNRAFHVNGKPFFPLMAWLQGTQNLASLKACGMNATAGYTGAGGRRNIAAYLAQAQQTGLYGVMPFEETLKGNPSLLGYIHGDEPDLTHQVSDARVEGAATLHLNPQTPLWKLVDGDLNSWSVLDPLEGASVTVHLPAPVRLTSVGVAITISKGLALPKEVVFESGGKELLRTAVTGQRGRQKFALPQPASVQDLTARITSTTPGEQVYGSLGEIEGYDAQGNNVLLSRPRRVPRAMPDETQREYASIKTADPSRPVFMTLTGHFIPFFKEWSEEQRTQLYPRYVQAADVVGYDIYPIYGWNKPEWLYLCHDATEQLVRLAGSRPVYAWIETSKGGQWTGPLENQKDVTPEDIRAEVWMCICRGATAIGYFTHIWKPSYAQFGVPEANRRALKQINDQITRLTPAILGEACETSPTIESSSGVKLDLLARKSGKALYVFAVNYDERRKPAEATIKVAGLSAEASVEVVDEGRTLRSAEGAFRDNFAPLAVHVYRIVMR